MDVTGEMGLYGLPKLLPAGPACRAGPGRDEDSVIWKPAYDVFTKGNLTHEYSVVWKVAYKVVTKGNLTP